jgi:hypothetical protein
VAAGFCATLCQFERQNGVMEPGNRLTKLNSVTRFSNMVMSEDFNVFIYWDALRYSEFGDAKQTCELSLYVRELLFSNVYILVSQTSSLCITSNVR